MINDNSSNPQQPIHSLPGYGGASKAEQARHLRDGVALMLLGCFWCSCFREEISWDIMGYDDHILDFKHMCNYIIYIYICIILCN